MRRRWTLGSIPMQMEKVNGKNHKSKLFLLSCLCALFWGVLLYYHFVVLGGSSIYGTSTLRSNPIRIEPLNWESSSRNPNLEPSYGPITGHVNSRNDTTETTVADVESESGVEFNPSNPNPIELIKVHPPDDVNSSSHHVSIEPKNMVNVGSIDDGFVEQSDLKQSNGPVEIEATNVVNDSKIGIGIEVRDPGSRNPTAKDVTQDLPFVRALTTAEKKGDPCGGRYIYVHKLPTRFNKDMLKECRSLSRWTNMCKYTTNDGLGPPLKNVRGVFSKTGWYATNQFAVDVIFNNRMKQYKCLTNDSSLAAAIFVPFYAGFDVARYLWGYNISTRDAASLDLLEWLAKRPEWKIMQGRDHFLVAGRITWDFRRLTDEESDWGSKLLFLPAARNMSMLVVESSPWNANDFAIPYPTYFHPAKDKDVFFWQNRMRKLKRQWLFSFAGAPRPGNPESIRGQIIKQCENSKLGKLLECDFGESKCHSPSSIMKMFQSSIFCLQPQGDSYTRRSAFDSMLAGCIPVFFHPGSAYTQYTWHLPKNFSTYSVFISENDIRKGAISIEERLLQISPQQVKKMRETVISLIPKLVYADPRSNLVTIPDAFDVSVQAVIDKVTRLRKNSIQGREEYDDFVEENSWKYALLEEGKRRVGGHEWDPFFSKPKEGEDEPSGSSVDASKNSWKIEQRGQLR